MVAVFFMFTLLFREQHSTLSSSDFEYLTTCFVWSGNTQALKCCLGKTWQDGTSHICKLYSTGWGNEGIAQLLANMSGPANLRSAFKLTKGFSGPRSGHIWVVPFNMIFRIVFYQVGLFFSKETTEIVETVLTNFWVTDFLVVLFSWGLHNTNFLLEKWCKVCMYVCVYVHTYIHAYINRTCQKLYTF